MALKVLLKAPNCCQGCSVGGRADMLQWLLELHRLSRAVAIYPFSVSLSNALHTWMNRNALHCASPSTICIPGGSWVHISA